MEKRGKGKEIILLVLAVVLVIVVGVSLLPKSSPAPKSEAVKASTAPTKKQPAANKKVASEKPPLPTAQALLGTSPGNSPTRNPFTSPATAASATQPTTGAENARPTTGLTNASAALPTWKPAPRPASAMTMPSLGSAFSSLFGGPSPARSPAVQASATPTETLQLSGVIIGKTSLAVIRKGAARYFVRRGDRISDRYVVLSIGHAGVTLKNTEGKKINLQIGGGE